MNVLHKPIYILYLDARSAFDLVVREILVAKLYHGGIRDQGLVLIDERLKNRKTFCEWDKKLMGPIRDLWGTEQGGKNFGEFYKVFNNDQNTDAQDSKLGVPLGGDLVISAVGQADDIGLASNDIFFLQALLDLSLDYCKKHHVHLSPGKTKLMAYSNNATKFQAYYDKIVSPINIDGIKVNFFEEAEHVGVTRSTMGNLPHIINRFASHKKAISAVAPMGLSRRRKVNPAASIKIQKIYGTPVLLSGIPSLVLKQSEISLVNQFMKRTIQHHLRLPESTPPSVIAFLSGSLPGKAEIHLRQLTIFGMILRMPGSVLHTHAIQVLVCSNPAAESWFQQIRDLCMQYNLPHPLTTLGNPPSKVSYKSIVKSKILDYWEQKLRLEASKLDSLCFFNPNFMSLSKPHQILTSCGIITQIRSYHDQGRG